MNPDRTPPPYPETLTVALLGKKVQLKNSIGNLILGPDYPFFTATSNSLIKESNNAFKVINTPDFFDEKCQFPDQQVIDFMAAAYPGPNLFILVIDRENARFENIVSQISKLKHSFGDDIATHLVVMLSEIENPNSISHLQEALKVTVITANPNLANDCKKLCLRRSSFKYDFKHYSREVVQRRRVTMEETSNNTYKTFREDTSLTCLATSSHAIAPRAALENPTVDRAVEDVFSIVLLGMTGTGKSASANTILAAGNYRDHFFRSEASSMPVTSRCEVKMATKPFQTAVRLVDTPDFFHEELENAQAEVDECRKYCRSQRTLILLVMQLGRITSGEMGILESLEERLGLSIRERTVVLLTHGDELKQELNSYVHSDPPLYLIAQKCCFRYHLFNNKSKDTKQVVDLIKKIPDYKSIFPKFAKKTENECKLC